MEHALGDGEDFELILAVPAEQSAQMCRERSLEVPLTEIGQFVERPGLWQRAADGGLVPLAVTGWEHRGDQ